MTTDPFGMDSNHLLLRKFLYRPTRSLNPSEMSALNLASLISLMSVGRRTSAGFVVKRADAVPRRPRTFASSSASANARAVTGSKPLMFSNMNKVFSSIDLAVSDETSTILFVKRCALESDITHLPNFDASNAALSEVPKPATPRASLVALSISSTAAIPGKVALAVFAAVAIFPPTRVGSTSCTAPSTNPERIANGLEPGAKASSAAPRPTVHAWPLTSPRNLRARSPCFSIAVSPRKNPSPASLVFDIKVPNWVDLNQPSMLPGVGSLNTCDAVFWMMSGRNDKPANVQRDAAFTLS